MHFQFFDPEADVLISAGKLPHWEQAGTTCFITFRTADSLPQSVLNQLKNDRDHWLRARGIDPKSPDWKAKIQTLSPLDQRLYFETFTGRWMDLLDDGHGECLLKQSKFSRIAADALLYFDGDRYVMGDFVVMPNHVHLLVQFPNAGQLKDQCWSWKHYSAVQIHKQLGRHGHFWQGESFDHLVRSAEQFEFLRKYIADNPFKAKLRPGEYYYYRQQEK